jgi:hypothetical protein
MKPPHEKPRCRHAFRASEPFDGFYYCIHCGIKVTKSEALLYWEGVSEGLFAHIGWKPGELNESLAV